MATSTLPKMMTVEEFLALPDDGVDRELIYGEMREKGMTVRNESHSTVMANVAYYAKDWVLRTNASGLKVVCGEAGFQLSQNPPLVVGVDVAISDASPSERRDVRTTLVRGIPHVAIEILSPSDSVHDVHEKTRLYLEHGVHAVWVIDPEGRTVSIYRQDREPDLYNANHTLTCESELPGFSVRVAELFK